MKTADNINNLFENSKITLGKDVDKKILDNATSALPHQPNADKTIWRIIMHSKTIKQIAAAIIIIAGILSLTLFDKTVPSVYALEKTFEAIQHIETLHLFGKDWDDHEFEMWIQLNPKTGIPEYVYDNSYAVGVLNISRPDKSYQYNKKSDRVLINSGKLYNISTAPAKIFEQLLKASKNTLNPATIEIDREVDVETGKEVIVVYFEKAKEARRIYIDPETNLPIRIVGLKNGHLGAIFKDIDYVEYNIELPENIFEFEISDDMKVVDMDHIMRQINDPQNGISGEGLTEQEAAKLLITNYWNAIIAGNDEKARKLSPAQPEIVDGSQLTELVEIGKPYIQNGCGIGKVVPCKLRFADESLKEVRLIIRFRKINNKHSYTIAGTWGGVVTIKE
ncbi:MAG: hypothetical protein ACYSUS_00720 [Planctomycetota bacterium]|jgi:outer membrane lipoprotein-sorting protein